MTDPMDCSDRIGRGAAAGQPAGRNIASGLASLAAFGAASDCGPRQAEAVAAEVSALGIAALPQLRFANLDNGFETDATANRIVVVAPSLGEPAT